MKEKNAITPPKAQNSSLNKEENKATANDESLLLQKLALGLSAGDPCAWEALYKKLYDPLTRFVLHIVRSKEDASDISQEVFAYLWKNPHKIQADKNIRSYAYKIAKSLAYDCLSRRAKAEGFASLSEYPEPPAVEDISPNDVIIADETRVLLAMALETMPEQRRQVFELSRYEGLSNEEIADKLKISKKTVENNISLVKKELKELLYLVAILLGSDGFSL